MISRLSEAERTRIRLQRDPWRRWYSTAKWQKLRLSILKRDAFTCQMKGCGRVEIDTALLVADHKVAHRGDPDLFWDAANLECLCQRCHNVIKQSIERGGTGKRLRIIGADGWPV